MVSVPVVPEVLRWAREERGFSVSAAETKLEFEGGFVEALERGDVVPTLGQLQRIATRYQISLASLLMPAPLPRIERHALHDFRAYGGQPADELEQETFIAIEEANEFVEVMSEIRDADIALVGHMDAPRYTLTDNPDSVSQQERSRIGLTGVEQLQFQDDRTAFLRWRQVIESQGVFVYQLKLGADDTRGFAIWDERQIPAIVVESAEGSYGPESFTLWHEYAHILLRMGGISNQNRSDRTERFCNQFAAAFLMPGVDFLGVAERMHGQTASVADAEVARLARRFRVSKTSVALRMEDLSLADDGFFQRMTALWATRPLPKPGGRASHEQRLVNKFGERHIEVVFAALDRKIINKMDAYEFTNIKSQYFGSVRQEIKLRRAARSQQP